MSMTAMQADSEISEGQVLPDADLLVMTDDGPQTVNLRQRLTGRKVVIFAVPGAFTRTCSALHLPSFIRTKAQFEAKGVDEIICISVNDPFVMRAWGEASGAAEAGITMLADPDGAFTRAIGMEFSAPVVGLLGRSKRFAMVVEDGTVTALKVQETRGSCDITSGEAVLDLV